MKTKLKSGNEYERQWGEVASEIDQRIAAGQQDVNQIAAEALEGLTERFLSGRRFRSYYENIGIRRGSDELPAERIDVCDGAYRVVPFRGIQNDTVISTALDVLSSHREQIDCVVELGSGTGRNLFKMFHAVKDRLGVELEMHACELTDTGRTISKTLHRLCPAMNLSIHAFDYYEPDLSFLGQGRNVLFVTVFSIEQISVLGKSVFDEMLARTNSCFCLHFEPVGWQFDEHLCEQRSRRDTPAERIRKSVAKRLRKIGRPIDLAFKTRFDRGFPGIVLERGDIGSPDRVSRNAAVWSAHAEYNKNLVSLLRNLEEESRITIEREDMNVYGDNPFNPASVILWKKNRD